MDDTNAKRAQLRLKRLKSSITARNEQKIPPCFSKSLGSCMTDSTRCTGDQNGRQETRAINLILSNLISPCGGGIQETPHGPEFPVALILQVFDRQSQKLVEMAIQRSFQRFTCL